MSEAAIAEIKPIETSYGGCRFRSRLEARWAVFFDALGLRWEYEPEAYALPSGNYLPDFRLHLKGGPVWFEVKPPNASNDDDRWGELADATNLSVFIAFGMPRVVHYEATSRDWLIVDLAAGRVHTEPESSYDDLDEPGYIEMRVGGNGGDSAYSFCVCRCGKVGIEFDGRSARICGDRCYPDSDKMYNWSDPALLNAFRRAHSARFEPRRGAR